jgi:aspartyl-tRNA(Asn)/glutamyl-tRNA(Gln) amidotransferase subunit B
VDDAWLAEKKAALPEMPDLRRERFVSDYGLARDEAGAISREQDLAEFFEAVATQYPHAGKAANWIISQLVPALKDQDQTLSQGFLTPERFTALLSLVDTEQINAAAAKAVLVQMLSTGQPPETIVDTQGFRQVSDTTALEKIVDSVLAAHPSDVEDYRAGNPRVLGFLMGRAMKAARGQANPKRMKEILTRKLSP